MRENPNMSGTADRQTNVGRESNVGWHESVPPNGFAKRPRSSVTDTNDNPAGLAAEANELETTPEHYNLVAGDPTVSGWTRRYDDPNVVALRERLDRENGIPDLELVEPADVDRAVELFDRDGFVAVRDALDPSMLERMRMAVDRAVELASGIGYPIIMKASAGCGGKGMRIAWTEAELIEGFNEARDEAATSFGDDRTLSQPHLVCRRAFVCWRHGLLYTPE